MTARDREREAGALDFISSALAFIVLLSIALRCPVWEWFS